MEQHRLIGADEKMIEGETGRPVKPAGGAMSGTYTDSR
jgi:hypothetical protein